MKNIPITLFLIAIALTFTTCKKKCNDPTDPNCDNYDPCSIKISAGFTIEDVSIGNPAGFWRSLWQPDISDTIIGLNATFTAIQNNVQYEWHIGSGVYTTKSVTLNFQSVHPPATIPITLTVKRLPGDQCFQNDSMNTSTRNMVIPGFFPFYGFFNGHYTDNPSDTFTVSFSSRFDSVWMSNQVYVNNVLKGCGSFWETASEAYKEIAFNMHTDQCQGLQADAIMDKDNNITINLSYFDPNDPTYKTRINKTFVGKKKY